MSGSHASAYLARSSVDTLAGLRWPLLPGRAGECGAECRAGDDEARNRLRRGAQRFVRCVSACGYFSVVISWGPPMLCKFGPPHVGKPSFHGPTYIYIYFENNIEEFYSCETFFTLIKFLSSLFINMVLHQHI